MKKKLKIQNVKGVFQAVGCIVITGEGLFSEYLVSEIFSINDMENFYWAQDKRIFKKLLGEISELNPKHMTFEKRLSGSDKMSYNLSVSNAIGFDFSFKTKNTQIKFFEGGSEVWSKEVEGIFSFPVMSLKYMFFSSLKPGNKIIALNTKDGGVLWQLDLSELGKYTDHEGEHSGKVKTEVKYFAPDNSVIFGVTDEVSKNWAGKKFLSVDAESGDIKWIYKPEDERTLREDFYFYKNLMYLLSGSNLLIIDPYTGKVKEDHDLSDQFSANSLESFNNYTIQNNKLYFSDTDHKKIGVINLSSYQIEEVVKVETENADWIEQPVVNNKYLYVKDSNNTLHVFELDAKQ